MALTVVEPPAAPAATPAKEQPETFEPPPDVIITPCNPWPKPYYLEDGLRRVAPYHHTYNTFAKARWLGREVLEIFTKEFRDRPAAYYVSPSVPCISTIMVADILVRNMRLRPDR
jgi:tRNA pseudouridine synthase 9